MFVFGLKHGQAGVLSLRFVSTAVLVFCLNLVVSAEEASDFSISLISKGVTSRPIQMRFVGSNPSPVIEQVFEHAGNPKTETSPANGPRRAVPQIQCTIYRQVYDGVDLVTYSDRGRVQYDLVVAPGTDPQVIRIVYEGFENVELYAELPGYQIISGSKAPVPVVMEKTERAYYHLVVGTYNSSLDLIIPTTSVPITARSRSYAQLP
jgi:hypothetical protein